MAREEMTFYLNIDDNSDKVKDKLKEVKTQLVGLGVTASDIANIKMKGLSDETSKATTEAKKMVVTMDQLNTLNESAFKILESSMILKIKDVDTEIAATQKKSKEVKKLIELYEEKDKLIRQQAEEQKARIEKQYTDEILKAETTMEAKKYLAQALNDEIGAIERKRTSDLEANTKAQVTAMSALFDQSVSDILKKSEKVKTHGTETTKENVAEIKKQTEAATDAVAKGTEAVAKKTEEAKKLDFSIWKGVVDVDATKENIKAVTTELENYKQTLIESDKKFAEDFKQLQDEYFKSLDFNNPDFSGLNKLNDIRLEYSKKYKEEDDKIEAAITENKKRENALRLQQMQGYAENVKKITSNIIAPMATAAKGVFTELNNSIDIEIKAIEDKKKETEVKKVESELRSSKFNEEKAEQNKLLAAATTQAEKDEINLRIKNLDDAINTEKDIDKKYTDEGKRLDNEKKKKEEQKRKNEKIQKKIELSQKIIEGTAEVALAVTKALAAGPFIGQVLAAIAAASGAVQIGILTTQYQKLEQGGLLHGKRHAQGGMRVEGTNIEVEGGEYVVNRQSTGKNLGLLSYINHQRRQLKVDDIHRYFAQPLSRAEVPLSRKFEAGGYLTPTLDDSNSLNSDELIDAIRSMKFEPRVAVTDILRVQDEMTSVDGWSGM